MNKVILIGRLTRDPEVKRTSSDLPYVQFSIAVDRNYQNKNGERQADFINCIAWRATADLIGRYVHKGNLVGVEGQIQTNTYDDPQTGMRRTTTSVLVEQIQFLERRQDNANQNINPFADMVSPQSYNNQGYNNGQRSYNNSYNNNYQQNRPEPKQENPFDNIGNQFDISNDDLPF